MGLQLLFLPTIQLLIAFQISPYNDDNHGSYTIYGTFENHSSQKFFFLIFMPFIM